MRAPPVIFKFLPHTRHHADVCMCVARTWISYRCVLVTRGA